MASCGIDDNGLNSLSSDGLAKMVKLLETSIRSGDVSSALSLVQDLTLLKAPVRVAVDEDNISTGRKFRLKVQFEDRFVSGPSIELEVHPSNTIGAVKSLIHEKLKFPPEVQRCIVGKRLRHNKETLASCGLTFDGCMVFIYILSAKAVGLSAESEAVADGCALQASLESSPSTISASSSRSSSISSSTVVGSAAAGGGAAAAVAADGGDGAATAVAAAADVSIVVTNDANGAQLKDDTLPEAKSWSCQECTYLNHPDLNECEICATARKVEVQKDNNDLYFDCPEEPVLSVSHQVHGVFDRIDELELESQRKENYNDLLLIDQCHLVRNIDRFQCPICFEDCSPGHGAVLRECLHTFCCLCLQEHIRLSECAEISCPFNNGEYQCNSLLLDREIKALVNEDVYQKHLQLSLREAESKTPNSYHCVTPNCTGWCVYEDEVNMFFCYVCRHVNCLTCRAIHEHTDCIHYQRQMKDLFAKDHAARMSKASLEELFKFGEALKCPRCQVILMKKDGCDWVKCTMCRTEICWVTRQARWGPMGKGDESAGCGCKPPTKLCHPDCRNCH